ncbi:MAG: guanylate kinase [Acutalibacteraceae bacterium]|nr:guanylate kinase [Acutalibacteraceae bacterium]
MSKGKLFIVSGPSGSGKDTILQGVFKKHPEIKLSISSITRAMRAGEVEGEKYHFISRDEFEELLKNDMLLEHNVFVGNYYGTPKAPVEECLNAGGDMILEIDVNGAAQVREKMPEAISIFIMPPSFEVLKNRLSGRGTETAEVVEQRMTAALGEIARAKEYDYIVINDQLDVAIDDLLSIILSERLRINRQKQIIDEVLEKC